MADPFVLSHIRRLPLFANCSATQLQALASIFQQEAHHPGDSIYRQGEDSHALYLFVSGAAQLWHVGADGIDKLQHAVSPGEYVGESSLFVPAPRAQSLVVTEESLVLVLTRGHFDAILHAYPDIQAALAHGGTPAPGPQPPRQAAPYIPPPAAPQPLQPPAPQPYSAQPQSAQPHYPHYPGSSSAPPQQPAPPPQTPYPAQPQYPQQLGQPYPPQPAPPTPQYPQYPGVPSPAAQSPVDMQGGERVLLNVHRHSWIFLTKVLRAIGLFFVLMAITALAARLPAAYNLIPLTLCGIGFVVPILLTLFYYFDWQNDFFTLTDQRIIHQERYLLSGREQREQLPLYNIQNVELIRPGYFADLLGYGTIIVGAAGTQLPITLDHVPHPGDVQKLISDQVDRIPPAQRGGGANNQGGRGAGTPNVPAARSYSGYSDSFFPAARTVQGGRVVYHRHWLILLGKTTRPIVAGILLLFVIGIRLFSTNAFIQSLSPGVSLTIIGVWLAIVSFWFLWGYIAWREDVYVLDTDSVLDIVRAPFGLREQREQASLRQIQNVTSQIHSLWGSIFNEGDVVIETAGQHGQMVFRNVHKPAQVADEILQRVRQNEAPYRQ